MFFYFSDDVAYFYLNVDNDNSLIYYCMTSISKEQIILKK